MFVLELNDASRLFNKMPVLTSSIHRPDYNLVFTGPTTLTVAASG